MAPLEEDAAVANADEAAAVQHRTVMATRLSNHRTTRCHRPRDSMATVEAVAVVGEAAAEDRRLRVATGVVVGRSSRRLLLRARGSLHRAFQSQYRWSPTGHSSRKSCELLLS